jgi:hypothetical protein
MDIQTKIILEAQRRGVPPSIALAVAHQESSMRHYLPDGQVIRGQDGEWGLFQVMLSSAADVLVFDPWNLDSNIRAGVGYLRLTYDWTGTGDWRDALQAYNGGIGNWRRGTVSQAAKRYADQVLARAGMLQVPQVPTPAPQPQPQPEPGQPEIPEPITITQQGVEPQVFDWGTVFSVDAEGKPPLWPVIALLALGAGLVIALNS